MTTQKRTAFFSIMGIIIFLMGGYLTLDWYQFFSGTYNIQQAEVPWVRATKVAVSFLSAIIVFIIGKDGFDRKDTRRLFLVYLVIFIGDIFLVLDIELVGTGVFALSHVFYIIRNGAGFSNYMRDGNRSHRFWDAASAVIILTVITLTMTLLYYPMDGGSVMFYAILGYSLFLGVSVWTAWTSLRIGYFPTANAILAGIGMSLFLASDLTVGIHFLTEPGKLQVFSIYLCWIFYTPALVLPALSGYDLDKVFSGKNL